jgi:hypothetical protein
MMDRTTLKQFLTEADDHLDLAARRIERQSLVVRRLRDGGHDASMAEELLAQFERTRQSFLVDRELIARSLATSRKAGL